MRNPPGSHRAARGGRRGRTPSPRAFGPRETSDASAPPPKLPSAPPVPGPVGPPPRRPVPNPPSASRGGPAEGPPEPGAGRIPRPYPPAGRPAGAVPAGAVPAGAVGGRAAARLAARRRRAAERPETLRRLVPQALVVAFLAGGTAIFVAHDKTVELTVEGRPRTLHTFAGDVRELLADEGVPHGPHDIVAPAPGEELTAGDQVVVRYGRPVTLTLDGRSRRVWTTARTVDGALRQLGVRAEGAYLSASRHSSITREGLSLHVRTERTLTLLADGREHTVRTNAATVREAVEQAGIALRGEDVTSAPPDSFPRDGQTVSVLRVTRGTEKREQPIPYRRVERSDPFLFAGTEVVERQGRQGVKRVHYEVRTVNGAEQKPKKLRTEVVRRPVDEVVRVGTAARPARVTGADGLNWAAVARCESGGRPRAVDPSGTYGGLYQFDLRTWQALGGRGRPQDAPAEEQTYRAKKLYVQRGASPWPHCGRKLHR